MFFILKRSMQKRQNMAFGYAPFFIIAILVSIFHYFHEHSLFHIVAELLTTSISFGMWIIGLNTYKISKNYFFAFLGIAFGFIGGLDLLHSLSSLVFRNVVVFGGFDQRLWCASRFIEALSLAVSVLFINRTLNLTAAVIGYGTACAVAVSLSYLASGILPSGVAYIGITCMFSIAAVSFFVHRRQLTGLVYQCMLLAVSTAAGSGILLIDAPIESNRFMFAHLLNFLSFYLIYKALIETTLQSPFQTLFQNLSSVNASLKKELAAREKAEAALRANEQKYREVVNSLPDLLFRMLPDGTILEVVRTSQFKSYLSAEIVGKNIIDVLPSDIAANYLKKAEETRRGHLETGFEYRIIIDGEKLYREARLIDSGKGEILVLTRDVTERNKNLAEIRMLYHAIRQSASMVIISDAQGNITYANPKLMAITGYFEEEIIGKNIQFFKSRYNKPEFYKSLWVALLMGQNWYGEFQIEKKDGEVIWVSANISPFRNLEGVTTRFIAILEDVTERREAEQRLRESENRYRSLLEQSSDGIFVFNPLTKKIEEANAHFFELLGYDESYKSKLKLTDIYSVENRISLEECLDTVKGNQKVTGLKMFRAKEGNTIYVETSASLIRIGEKELVMVNVRDVTEERRLQEALKKDFALAAAVQNGFLQPPFSNGQVEIQTIFEPAHIVSGDLYGYKWKGKGNVLFGFLFDIMGHGLSTALKTSALMLLFSQAAEKEMSLKEKMEWINAESMNLFNDDTFAAAICFELDLKGKMFRYVSAGITHFFASSKQLSGQIQCEGDLLGVNPAPVYDEKVISVNRGDNYFFITDGLLEILLLENLNLSDFTATVTEFRHCLALSAKRRDDASAICLTVK